MALYKPLSQAGVTSARPVQDDSEQVPVEYRCVLVADIYLVHSNVKPFDTLLFSLSLSLSLSVCILACTLFLLAIHSSRVSQNNPAPQYPMMSNVPTANGT